ncbi:DUF7793 family protein [Lacinutrix sp. MEBiC02404]
MRNEILINNIKFWVDQKIVYCKLYDDSDVDYSDKDIQDIFCEAISLLSDSAYLPVIFDFKEINSVLSVKLFKLLSSNIKIKSAVLSKAFLVKNYKHKILLSFYVMFSDSNVPNLIFKDPDLAIQYSNQNYAIFNSVTYDN